MKNQGTLIGAPIRVNDDQDTYPSAIDNEIKGGLHSVNTTDERDAIPAARRSPGMQCYVFADGNTYELANDLVTWTLYKGTAGGSTDPGAGGDSDTVALISGNFGPWTDVGSKSSQFVNENFPLQYKADLQAFPTRAIVYLQGQFGLNAGFSGTTITLGNLPLNSRPANQLKKYFITNNIEMYLVIETNGDIKIESADGINLPVTTGTPEPYPYYVDCFFNPVITTTAPTTHTSTRTENFTRNNCPTGDSGSVVSFSRDYTSTISQANADAQAAADPNFEADGQAYANANGTCSVDPVNNAFVVNDRNAGTQRVIFTDSHGGALTLGATAPGATGAMPINPAETFSVQVINDYGPYLWAQINGGAKQLVAPGGTYTSAGGISPVITVTLTDVAQGVHP